MSNEHLMPSSSSNDHGSNFYVPRNESMASSLKADAEVHPKSPQEGATADTSQNSVVSSDTGVSFSTSFHSNLNSAAQFLIAPHVPEKPIPERRKKKPYKELTLEEKVELIRMAEENSSLSQASIAEKYSIAKSNVCRILQRKAEYLRAFESAGFAGSRKRKLRGDLANNFQRHFRPPQPNLDSQKQAVMSCSSGSSNSREPNGANSETPEGIVRPIARNPFDCNTESAGSHATSSSSNETLRMHMAKQHNITRLFMCRCCNWAFPDKTSYHLHIQAKADGKTVPLPLAGKGMHPGSELLNGFTLSGLVPGLVGPQSLPTAPNMFAQLNSIANAVPGLPFGSEGLAQFFPPFSLMPQANEELLNKLRERLFINQQPWSAFQNPLQSDLMAKLAKKDSPTNTSSSDALDQSVNSISSNSSTDESEEIQVIEEDPHDSEIRDRSSPVHEQAKAENLSARRDSTVVTSTSNRDDKINTDPANYYSGGALQIDDQENSPLNIVDPTDDDPGPNVNGPSSATTNSSISPSNSSSTSATSCYNCTLFKTKLAVVQTRCSYLEVHSASTQQEVMRLREQNELLVGKLLECREKALSFMQSDQSLPFVLNEMLKVTLFP